LRILQTPYPVFFVGRCQKVAERVCHRVVTRVAVDARPCFPDGRRVLDQDLKLQASYSQAITFVQDACVLDASVVDEGACFAGEILKDDSFRFEPQLAMMRTDPIAPTAHCAVGPAANQETPSPDLHVGHGPIALPVLQLALQRDQFHHHGGGLPDWI
jgi:hypothetical protein